MDSDLFHAFFMDVIIMYILKSKNHLAPLKPLFLEELNSILVSLGDADFT